MIRTSEDLKWKRAIFNAVLWTTMFGLGYLAMKLFMYIDQYLQTVIKF